MNSATRTSYLEKVFCRGCLESLQALPSVLKEKVVPSGSNSCEHAPMQLHQLKRCMLHGALESTPNARLFKKLCGAANEAEELAWETDYPLLLFPCLFEELSEKVLTSWIQHGGNEKALS